MSESKKVLCSFGGRWEDKGKGGKKREVKCLIKLKCGGNRKKDACSDKREESTTGRALKEENVSEENPVGSFSIYPLRQREREGGEQGRQERKCRKGKRERKCANKRTQQKESFLVFKLPYLVLE